MPHAGRGGAGPHGAVSAQVVAIAERYPELKADTAFLSLQKSLVGHRTADRAGAKLFQRHRDALQHPAGNRYSRKDSSPLLGTMKLQALMEANDFERAPVTVNLTPVEEVQN